MVPTGGAAAAAAADDDAARVSAAGGPGAVRCHGELQPDTTSLTIWVKRNTKKNLFPFVPLKTTQSSRFDPKTEANSLRRRQRNTRNRRAAYFI